MCFLIERVSNLNLAILPWLRASQDIEYSRSKYVPPYDREVGRSVRGVGLLYHVRDINMTIGIGGSCHDAVLVRFRGCDLFYRYHIPLPLISLKNAH